MIRWVSEDESATTISSMGINPLAPRVLRCRQSTTLVEALVQSRVTETAAQNALRFYSSRLIRLAIDPPPNPLSMFPTETLLAQLFNMPNSAAKPWKLAP